TQEEETSSENGETYTPSSDKNQDSDYEEYPNQESNYGQNRKNEYPGYARNYEETMPAEEEYYEEESPDGYESGGNQMNSDTMIEVAEQVFSEKIKKLEEDLRKLKEFRNISAPVLEDMNERLKRIEKNFDKMQVAILERVGSFGKNIDSLQKEVEMVEDSFEKLNKKK
ncbi:MAG: hypothetical protein Q8Q04_00320, partial [archaeon]|nr:hypothetical protein [archaeon]